MKKIRKRSVLALTVGIIMMLFVGCSNKEKIDDSVNFEFTVESNKGFNSIELKTSSIELLLEPRGDETVIKEGKSITSDFPKEDNVNFSIKVIKDNEILLEDNIELDLSNDKKADVRLVDKKDGGLEIKVDYK